MAPLFPVNSQANCKLDNDGEYLAVIQQAADRHRLKVWDTQSNLVKSEFYNDQITKFTCMSWGTLRVDNAPNTQTSPGAERSKKKRKGTAAAATASSADNGTAIKVVALGTNEGSVNLYSVSHGSLLKTLCGGHSRKVNDFCFASNDSSQSVLAYSCDDSGQLVEWDLNSCAVKRQWSNGNSGAVSRIAVDGSVLFAAGSSLNIWDLNSKSLLKTYPGHATAVLQIIAVAEQSLALTIAAQDRFLNIWKLTDATNSTINALTLDANAISVHALGGHILAVVEDGTVAVWRSPFTALSKKQKKSKTKRFESLLKIQDEKTGSPLPILAAKFIQPDQIMLVYGQLAKPSIEIISLDKDQTEIVLKREANNDIFIDNDQIRAQKQLTASTALYNENKAMIAAQNDFVPAKPQMMEEDTALSNDADITLQEKLDALAVSEEKSSKTSDTTARSAAVNTRKSTPKADSVQQMLIQALHSGDHQLLEECLEMGDLRLIFNTIHRLPTSYVVPFLRQIVVRFQARPGRGTKLAKWIKAVLLIHMSYLMTVPGLTKDLGPLYQTIDMRLAAFKKLLRLQGRLDVLDQHIRLRKEAAEEGGDYDESALEVPMVVYDENEASWSEEEDDMEIEEGLAEDAAVVENGFDSEGWQSSEDEQ